MYIDVLSCVKDGTPSTLLEHIGDIYGLWTQILQALLQAWLQALVITMVFVKVRETYDLCTVEKKMTVIGIHTPGAEIIKKNYPGLLMQCRAYRPVSADVQIACASVMPADVQSVGTETGDIAPEDLFNPILYKAMSNQGMSQVEARINALTDGNASGDDVRGQMAVVDHDSLTTDSDDFALYYGFLSDTHQWRHANPQSGLSMRGLKPLVYELLYSVGDNMNDGRSNSLDSGNFAVPGDDGFVNAIPSYTFKGHAKPMPFINCTSYTASDNAVGTNRSGFGPAESYPVNAESFVPAPQVMVGCIIVPPSRLHQLFYRMVVEWTIEFSSIRSISEITNWAGLKLLGDTTHYQSYDYSAAKTVAGVEDTTLVNSQSMVDTNVDIKKVM